MEQLLCGLEFFPIESQMAWVEIAEWITLTFQVIDLSVNGIEVTSVGMAGILVIFLIIFGRYMEECCNPIPFSEFLYFVGDTEYVFLVIARLYKDWILCIYDSFSTQVCHTLLSPFLCMGKGSQYSFWFQGCDVDVSFFRKSV